MSPSDRRTFLKLVGTPALAAALPGSIVRALEIPAHNRTGTIADVEHIIFLMQENRSFDHLFGTMRGVRGFADPRAIRLRSGAPVWQQPVSGGAVLPFRPDVENVGLDFLPDPPHGWNDTHAAWNGGEYDQWVPNKGVTSMTYHTRNDVPYHYALADAFTVCDGYHCALMGPTDPNRYHMWSGWVGNDGSGGGPVITNAEAGYDWSTYPERLQRAGISWKVYQDVGVGLDAAGFWGWTENPYIGNFGDNSLLYFHQYQNAVSGTPLAKNARTGTNILAQNMDPERLLDIFRDDLRRGRLPQVSWIVAPEAYCEHPNWPANYGAWYVSQVIDALVANPDVFSRTVLFINYDEEGGFFDHMVPPTPPRSRAEGWSSVDTRNEIFPGDQDHISGPYGLGVRVPMLVVSPWSKGGWVNSQVFDHTSLIRFLEARFAGHHSDLIETNITPWRRAISGDLTTAFDFSRPEAWRDIKLPSTSAYLPPDFDRHPDNVPAPPSHQRVPAQERGVRPARALPYRLSALGGQMAGGLFQIEFANSGQAAAVFQVRSAYAGELPRTYTVGPHKKGTDTWNGLAYDLSVYGPNGFFRRFAGSGAVAGPNIEVREQYEDDAISVRLTNHGERDVRLHIVNAYAGNTIEQRLLPHESETLEWPLRTSWGWYDLLMTVAGDPSFVRQLAGHVENGEDSISDPAMGRVVLSD